MQDRPNILLILTDQQSATMLGCAGNEHVRTPAMDGIADAGVRFERAYCTNPVCVPSRFSLMTGLMPSAIGMLSNSLEGVAEIPEAVRANALGHLLRRAGYETAYGGKVHLPRMTAQDIGFEYICRDERDELAESCAGFIAGRKGRSGPFCLVASFVNPHDICYMAIRDSAATDGERRTVEHGPVECAELDAALARPAGLGEGAFFAGRCPPLPANFEPQDDEPEAVRLMLEQRPFRARARAEWSPERWREHRWAYARLTERVDGQIARVLAALRESGQSERTLVVFTSDHGDMDSAHRMEHKSGLYEEACRVPLIVRTPGRREGGRVDREHPVSNGLDLLPTLCDWAGLEPQPGLPGRSLRPLVEGADGGPWRQSVPVESAIGRALAGERFKYARYFLGAGDEQLIDLREDPGEMRNALHNQERRRELAEMRAQFQRVFGPEQPSAAEVLAAANVA